MNTKKNRITFCPGPGAYLDEWFKFQTEFFGRGDNYYQTIKKKTLDWIKKKSGQDNIIPIAGSGTTAAIISINSFLKNNVLVIDTGYYSKRWINYIRKSNLMIKMDIISYEDFIKSKIKKKYNWILFVYVETASCTKYDINKINSVSKTLNCKLMVDATASIGLETNHSLADVIFFSSCKGLLGPTGLGFIGHKNNIRFIKSNDFWFNLDTHSSSKYTLGYNCIASLYGVSKKHSVFKSKILYAHKIMKEVVKTNIEKPIIGVPLKYQLSNKLKKNDNLIFYEPRDNPGYDVLFFLGLVKLGKVQIKKFLKKEIIKNLITK